MKATLFALLLAMSSMAMAQNSSVLVSCSFSEATSPGLPKTQTKEVENPFGGGKVLSFKKSNGDVVSVTVMLERNEDDKNLLDMTLLLTSKTNESLGMVISRGLSNNRFNGVSTTLFADKNGSIYNNNSINCQFK